MKVTLLQMNIRDDKVANLTKAERMVRAAVAADRPRLVVLPECFDVQGGASGSAAAAAEPFPDSDVYRLMQSLAAELRVFIHAGSVGEREGEKIYNTSAVFDDTGREVARYRKIHMFDVETPDGQCYRESDTYSRGDELVVYEIDSVQFGCAICYDLRFPELFLGLVKKGVEVIVLPAAFTMATGKDHWEPLIRARAIETETYFLASGQVGEYFDNGENRQKYGRSMVVGPWGTIVAQAEDTEGWISARLDFGQVRQVRSAIPVQSQRVLG